MIDISLHLFVGDQCIKCGEVPVHNWGVVYDPKSDVSLEDVEQQWRASHGLVIDPFPYDETVGPSSSEPVRYVCCVSPEAEVLP